MLGFHDSIVIPRFGGFLMSPTHVVLPASNILFESLDLLLAFLVALDLPNMVVRAKNTFVTFNKCHIH